MTNFFHHMKLTLRNFVRYLPLLQNLISRELKNKYRQSVLGYVWCVLNPLLVLMILNYVFSHMFKNSIENYLVYLFSGRMIFSFITDSTSGAARSIIANGSLMRKTRIPNYIFTLANLCSSVINLLFTMVAFAIVLIATKTPITVHAVMFPVLLIQVFLFCLGLGFFLAQANVFIRDTGYIYAVFTTGWMYLTPLFYPLEQLPKQLKVGISLLNPAYYYVQQSRLMFLYHQWPGTDLLMLGFGAAILFFLIGLYSYHRAKDKLILYV